jgi:outer membrane protein assembly factor BamA
MHGTQKTAFVVVLLVGFGLLIPAIGAAAAGIAGEEPAEGLAPSYIIEAIKIRGNRKTRDSVIRRTLQVKPGERLSVDDPRFALSRFQVLSLGHFSEVNLKLEKGAKRGRVILVVEVVERGTILLTEIFLGSSEATTAWGGLGVAERNFLGRGIGVDGAFVLGSDPEVERGAVQQSYRLRVSTRQVAGSALSISAGGFYLEGSDFFRRSGPESSSDPDDFLSIRYRRIGGVVGLGFDIARFFRLYIDYRGETVKSSIPSGAVRRDPDGNGTPIDFGIRDGTSVLSTISITLVRDSRSDPVLPQRGSRLSLTSDFSSGVLGSTYHYVKLSANYQHFFPVPWGHILAVQAGGGMLFGAAPFYEKFFIGDFNDLVPGRALGLNFSTLPSRDIFGTAIDSKRYEEIALRTGVEYIVPWFRGGKFAYGGDFFLNVGLISLTSRNELRMRDRSLSESIPVDLTVDAGLRLDTQIGIFRFSIGNLLGRIPF